jgi:glycosyltransferase involved in cell wall biosynthesis
MSKMAARSVSVISPFYNEKEALQELATRISRQLDATGRDYEIILVDDGSDDGGGELTRQLAESNQRVRVIRFLRNFGKAAALMAGIKHASGDIVITMDADLQDDPAELPRFLEAIADGADVVSGWKRVRHDPFHKTLPSRVFNAITSWVFHIELHDINCGFKAYTRRAAQHLDVYGELHRFTPALLHGAGFKCTEIEVKHHPRRHGVSKYGARRLIKGLLDLVTVLLITRYKARPLHFFSIIGLPLLALGGVFITYLTILWFMGLGPIGNRPLLLIGILLMLTGVQLTVTGLIAELILSRTITDRDRYVIGEAIGFDD